MRIALCVSVPNHGLAMLENLLRSAVALASGEHSIELDFTYNSDEERDHILNANLPVKIGHSHFVAFKDRATIHSNCINALFSAADADIAIICDYDTAFVARDWDATLVDIIKKQGIHFFGSPYSATDARPKVTFGKQVIQCLKYQEKPNAIFLAYSPADIKPLTNHLCEFAKHYADESTIAAKFIGTTYESACYRLPIGSFVHLDTGYRIAELIEEHHLKFASLTRHIDNYKVVTMSHDMVQHYPPMFKPEEYDYQGKPFVVHFRKASLPEGKAKKQKLHHKLLGKKGRHFTRPYTQEQFFSDIAAYAKKA